MMMIIIVTIIITNTAGIELLEHTVSSAHYLSKIHIDMNKRAFSNPFLTAVPSMEGNY